MTTGPSLAELRKQLQKTDIKDLCDGALVKQTLETCRLETSDDMVPEILTTLSTLFRQLRAIFESASNLPCDDIIDFGHGELASALLPNGEVSALIMGCLESNLKPKPARAAETLSAACRMVSSLPPPSTSSSSAPSPNILLPLFESVTRHTILTRSDLVAINTMISIIPTRHLHPSLSQRLISDMPTLDCASPRCSILADMLCRDPTLKSLESLLPLFKADQPSTLLNLTRYLLPTIFASKPHSVPFLLDLLASEELYFPAWITVASLGVSLGHIRIKDLPGGELDDAICHVDYTIRLRAFQLLTTGKDLLEGDVVELTKRSLVYNAGLASAGARSELASAVYAYLKNLHAVEKASRKAQTVAQNDTVSEDLHQWFLQSFVDQGLAVSCRQPVTRAIVALQFMGHYVDIFGKRDTAQSQIYTMDRVDSLLACQRSEFTEVRTRAREILDSATIPLPGYETIGSHPSQALLASALGSINHPRKVQAEAGKAALCFLFRIVSKGAQGGAAVTFVERLVAGLDDHLMAVERNLAVGIESKPLHGLLAALSDVIACISLETTDARQSWKPVFTRILWQISRVWAVTRPVISLTPTQNGSDGHRADHEIARAYDVLETGEEDGEEAMDHTGLLSGCWRAMKEAAELLSTLFRIPLSSNNNEDPMWTLQDVDMAGQSFLTWLHEIRHRGTFSHISNAFSRLVEIVKRDSSLKPLCYSWLKNEIATIQTDTISVLRRSAALPYSILSIVSGDEDLLDTAFLELNALAEIDNPSSSDITKVHAFNVIKIVLLDARQTKLLDRYFERAVLTALNAFASPNWNVRNVGLILFSTLINRSLSSSRGSQDYYESRAKLMTRQTIAAWDKKYPRILPHVTNLLQTSSKTHNQTGINAHSPLFPILIILRSLRWTERGESLAQPLRTVVEGYLGSGQWQVRAVSSQALSSLLSPSAALDRFCSTESDDLDYSRNRLHGEMLLRRHLIQEVIEWEKVGEGDIARVEQTLKGILEGIQAKAYPPLVIKGVLDCASAYFAVRSIPSHHELVRQTALVAKHALAVKGKGGFGPGEDLLLEAATDILVQHDRAAISAILHNGGVTAQLVILTAIQDGRLEMDDKTSAAVVFLTRSASEAVMTAALGTVASTGPFINPSGDLARGILDLVDRTTCTPLREAALAAAGWAVAKVLSASSELDSALLERLMANIEVASSVDQAQPYRLAGQLALEPLHPLLYPSPSTSSSLATLAKAHDIILSLLQDDDEEIRVGAVGLVSRGLHLGREVCQEKALELEWSYIGSQISAIDSSNPRGDNILNTSENRSGGPFLDIALDRYHDRINLEAELRSLQLQPADCQTAGSDNTSGPGQMDRPGALFELESPNLFRDPLIDVGHATRLLKQHGHLPRDPGKEELRTATSPIDEVYVAHGSFKERLALQRS